MTNTNLYEETLRVLKEDNRLTSDSGELLTNKCIEFSIKEDKMLIERLVSNEKLKEAFFVDSDKFTIFQKEEFIQFLDNSEFIEGSYTKFKNKIGIHNGKEYLSENEDISLVWPYKDCILEGGQDDSDTSRNERFWNKNLSPDEVDRLTKPKVLSNFKRVSEDGEHSLEQITKSDNLFIRGNNLLALYSLLPVYRNEVKLIYLDPPYNTGNDSFKYNDSFNQSTWLTFMKNRLEVSKELLCKDGAIVVQIDDNQRDSLKLLMDEVFGKDRFKNSISVKMSNLAGPKMAHIENRLPRLKEHLLVYGGENFKYNPVKVKQSEWDSEYSYFLENFSKEDFEKFKNSSTVSELENCLEGLRVTTVSDKINELGVPESEVKEWKFENAYRIYRSLSNPSTKKAAEQQEAYKSDRPIEAVESLTGGEVYLIRSDYNRDVNSPRIRIQFAEQNLRKPVGDLWTDISTSGIGSEGGVSFNNGKKPEKLLMRIIKMVTDENDTVLDFFLGSGTTAAVSHKLNRHYIGIEQLDYEENDPTYRLENVINGEKNGVSEEIDWSGGGDFVYAELTKLNAQFLTLIDSSETSDDLLDIWERLKSEGFISYKLDLDELDFNSESFKQLSLESKKKFLKETLDLNQIYLNYSEISDETYGVSETAQELNHSFYSTGDLL